MFIPDTVDMNFNYEEQLIKCHNMKNSIDFCHIEVLRSINETIEHVKLCSSSKKDTHFQVLVTGSLKLVGGVLEVLQPWHIFIISNGLFQFKKYNWLYIIIIIGHIKYYNYNLVIILLNCLLLKNKFIFLY